MNTDQSHNPHRDARTIVRSLLRAGYPCPIPILSQSKDPKEGAGWNTRPEITEADIDQRFEPTDNVGVLDGAPVGLGYLADFDLDCSTVARVVQLDHKRPLTPAVFGRKNKPLSHMLFEVDKCLSTETFDDPAEPDHKKRRIAEFRCGPKHAGKGHGYTLFPGSVHPSGELILWNYGASNGDVPVPAPCSARELRDYIRSAAARGLLAKHWPDEGGRHHACLALAGLFFSAGVEKAGAARIIKIIVSAAPTSSPERIAQVEANVRDTYAAGAAGMPITGVPALKQLIDPRVVDAFLAWSGLGERLGNARKQERQQAGGTQDRTPMRVTPLEFPPEREPPKPLSRDAYHGVAGDFVDLVAPSSEASRASLLTQFLAACGMFFGRDHGYSQVESTRHYPKLYVALVGKTGKGRKGTSWDRVCEVFRRLEDNEAFVKAHIAPGLASGEGIIWHVRDPVYGWNKKTQESEIVDPGIEDKRILFVEPEFSKFCTKPERKVLR